MKDLEYQSTPLLNLYSLTRLVEIVIKKYNLKN